MNHVQWAFLEARRPGRSGLGALTTVGALLMVSSSAFANPVDLFGAGARGISMGSAFTAVADDPFAAYYNLGGLSQLKRPTVAVGLQTGHMALGDPGSCVEAQSGVGCSDPFYYTEGGTLTIQQKRYGYDDPNGVSVGLAMPFTKRLNFGFMAYVPMDVQYIDGQLVGVGMRLARFKTLDPYLPEYVMFQNRSQRFASYTGVSYEVVPGLGLGVGATILANAAMAMDIKGTVIVAQDGTGETEATTLTTQLNTQISLDLVPKMRPAAGILWNLATISPNLAAWQVGLTYRGQIGIDGEAVIGTDLALSTQLSEDEEPVQYGMTIDGLTLTFLDFYTPHQVAFGVSGLIADRVRVALDATWQNWSAFQLSVAQVPDDLALALGVDITLEDNRVIDTSGFRDTITPHLGVEGRLGPFLTDSKLRGLDLYLRGGFTYEQNPFPLQTGYTNLLNSDRVAGMFGTGITTHNPFSPERDIPISIDLAIQAHSLISTTHEKPGSMQNGNDKTDGVPVNGKYVSQGNIVQGALTMQMGF